MELYLCRNIHYWIIHKDLFASFGCKIHIRNPEAILVWTVQKERLIPQGSGEKEGKLYKISFHNNFTLIHSNIQKEDRN